MTKRSSRRSRRSSRRSRGGHSPSRRLRGQSSRRKSYRRMHGGSPLDTMINDKSPAVSKLGNQMSELISNIRRKLNLKDFGDYEKSRPIARSAYTFDKVDKPVTFEASDSEVEDSPVIRHLEQMGGKKGPHFGNYYSKALKNWSKRFDKKKSFW